MVLRHDETVVSAGYSPTLFPDLDPQMVRSALARSSFMQEDEIAAELLADLFARLIRDSIHEPRNFAGIFG